MLDQPDARSEAWPIDNLLAWADQDGELVEVRRMPWASVVMWRRNGCDRGNVVWGKAMCPGFASECTLLPLLVERCPEMVLEPLDTDAGRGLLLLPDGGPTLDGVVEVGQWTNIVQRYADLQQRLVGIESEVLRAGCVDLRPRQAVERLRMHMSTGRIPDRPHLLDWLQTVAVELSDDVPATIQHDDLAPSNVLASGRILDWGDASLGHPFVSLLSALMPGTSRRPGGPRERRAMRDAYLLSWADVLDLNGRDARDLAWLRRQADLAVLLAPIGRIDAWLRAPESALRRYPDAIDRWMRHLEDSFADPRFHAI